MKIVFCRKRWDEVVGDPASGERPSYEQFILFVIYVKAAPPVTQKEITWPIEPFCRRGNSVDSPEGGR